MTTPSPGDNPGMTPELKLWSDAVQVVGLAQAADALVDLKGQPGLVTVLRLLVEKAGALADALDGGIKILSGRESA